MKGSLSMFVIFWCMFCVSVSFFLGGGGYELFTTRTNSFVLGVSRCPLLLCRISLFNVCRNLMSSWDTVFLLGFVSRKSIYKALIIEVGVMGGISFEEIRWQYPAVFPGLFRGAMGPTIHHSSLVFTANGSVFFCNHFLRFQSSCAVISN